MLSPFKPNPHFLQWGPVREHPGSVLIVRGGGEAALIVHTPVDFWEYVPDVPELVGSGPLEISTAVTLDEIAAAVSAIEGRVAFIGDSNIAATLGLDAVNPDAKQQRESHREAKPIKEPGENIAPRVVGPQEVFPRPVWRS